METFFENENFLIEQNELEVSLRLKNEINPRITFKIDPHDNRLTAIIGDLKGIDQTMVQELCKVLDVHFGGKEFVVVDKKLAALFEEQGFTSCSVNNERGNRVRITTPKALQSAKDLKKDETLQEEILFADTILTYKEQLVELMAKSGFTPEKIQDYSSKGEAGLSILCSHSLTFALIKNEKLVAFCRVSLLGDGYGYLADTLVDEDCFGTKQQGTAYLYNYVGKLCQRENIKQLLLIAPIKREQEFYTDYGCKRPDEADIDKVVLVKFSAPGLALKETFEEQKKQSPTFVSPPKYTQ